jgi:O-antigen/teichoic acid export membrane protein
MLKALLRSPSLRVAAAMGIGGVCFSVGGLILARELTRSQYALVSLLLGIVSVAGNTAPLGLDQIIARRGIRLDARWRRASLGASLATAVAAGVVSGLLYHLPLALMASVTLITLTLGIAQSVGAHFQGQRRFGIAVWVVQIFNATIALIALVAAAMGLDTAIEVCALMSVVGLIAAAAIWWLLKRDPEPLAPQVSPWRVRGEALSLASMQAGGSTFLQIERLLIGPTLGLLDLATYGVLAAFVSSPFRLLQGAVQFTLIPRLREARDARARRALLRREGALVALPLLAGSAAIWLLAPPLAHWLLKGRYELTEPLITIMLGSGWLKLLNGFLTALVVACGEERRLGFLSVICWGSLGVSAVGAFAAIPWGLFGVLCGISVGWLVRCLFAGWLALGCLKERPATKLVVT